MTPEEIKELKKGIALTASYYGRELKTEVLQMMADDLSDLPFKAVSEAYSKYRRDPKNRAMPLPAQIREVIQPTPTTDSEARDVIERIKVAIAKFGWPQGLEARAYVGPVGWRVVEGLGGWVRLCESDFLHNPGLVAQARSRAEDLITFGDSFRGHVPLLSSPEPLQSLDERKFEAVKAFEQHQASKPLEIEIPSDEVRAQMIRELLSKHNKM